MAGRPKDPQKAEQRKLKLQEAARELLLEKSYRSITIREIAAKAGVQSAMISYDFGSKEQLFISLVEHYRDSVRHRLQALPVTKSTSAEQLIDMILDVILSQITHNLWLPRLAADEVIHQESAFGHKVIEQMMKPLSSTLIGLIERFQSFHILRGDFPPQLVALNIMSLLMFPILTLPVSQQLWGFSTELCQTDAWKQQLVSILSLGLTGENHEH